MKAYKKVLTLGLVFLLIIGSSISAYAVSKAKNPPEVMAEITGLSLESLMEERANTGKRYGEIAKDADKLEEFKARIFEIKEENLKGLVEEGKISSDEAKEILEGIKERQIHCMDGENPRQGEGFLKGGFGFGGQGQGQGKKNKFMGHGKGRLEGDGEFPRGHSHRAMISDNL